VRRAELPPQGSAVHPRHDQIGEQKIDKVRVVLGDLQSLPSVRGHEDLIPTLLQNDLGQRTQIDVVIDHEAHPSEYPPEAVRHYAAERWRPSLDVGRLADRDGLPRAARRHYLRAWWLGGGMRPLILAALPAEACASCEASRQDHTRIRSAILRRF
jgi:hypothetical protein